MWIEIYLLGHFPQIVLGVFQSFRLGLQMKNPKNRL